MIELLPRQIPRTVKSAIIAHTGGIRVTAKSASGMTVAVIKIAGLRPANFSRAGKTKLARKFPIAKADKRVPATV